MSETIRAAFEFEDLVADLLKANGFEIVRQPTTGADQGFDLTAFLAGVSWAVELKFYRTRRAQISLIRAAAARLSRLIQNDRVRLRGMLVVSSDLLPEHRLQLEQEYGIVFVDRTDLYAWCGNAPQLLDRLSALLDEETPSDDRSRGRAVSELPDTDTEPVSQPEVDTTGTDLCTELKALKKGKIAWKNYEALCDRILRYLFPADLHGWHTQKRTDDGLNRFDYICRIKQSTEFWRFLTEDLDSRYVLFEFKNYAGFIKQGQILTTEKYLLERALRRVAIIFSRKGAHKNAIKMAQGAMRESGKLLLVLDDENVCEMLHSKERGEDPSDLLFEWADEFLMSLPR
ncbi:MAG: restriction endonuclease [Verrucomicrobiae bacterium]|nr:restriction endonuclease [Verrucomicrobiae bacterium]